MVMFYDIGLDSWKRYLTGNNVCKSTTVLCCWQVVNIQVTAVPQVVWNYGYVQLKISLGFILGCRRHTSITYYIILSFFSLTSVSTRRYIVSCLPSCIAAYRATTKRKSLNLQKYNVTKISSVSPAVMKTTLISTLHTKIYMLQQTLCKWLSILVKLILWKVFLVSDRLWT